MAGLEERLGKVNRLIAEIREKRDELISVAIQDTGFLLIEHNVPGRDTIRVPIDSLPPDRTLIVTPNPINFGDVEGGNTADTDVRVYNAGADGPDIGPYRSCDVRRENGVA